MNEAEAKATEIIASAQKQQAELKRHTEAELRLYAAQYNTKLYEISLLQISGNVGEYLK